MVVDLRLRARRELLVEAADPDMNSWLIQEKKVGGAYLEVEEVAKGIASCLRTQLFEISETNHRSRKRQMDGMRKGEARENRK